jgi:hypothetical protein
MLAAIMMHLMSVKKCKPHVNKQIMLIFADVVVRDMPMLSSAQSHVENVSPNLLQRTHVIFCIIAA